MSSTVKKVTRPERRLEDLMSWDPERTGKPEPVSPREMKEIWNEFERVRE